MTDKIVRGLIIGTIFIAFLIFQGIKEREANQLIFMLSMVTIFSLFLRNLWATLFVVWTVYLYAFFHFTSGAGYLSNILFGSMLYLFTKICFKKKHIDLYIESFLWFVCGNLFYCVLQALQYDFIYKHHNWNFGLNAYDITNIQGIAGFMGHHSIIAALIALSIPMVASRTSKMALWTALMLFVPLYMVKTSLCFLAGIIGFLFVSFFKVKRWLFVVFIAICIAGGFMYVKKVDSIGTERFVQWRASMQDYMVHPITGWGLDSYANVTPYKEFKYPQIIKKTPNFKMKNGEIKNLTAITFWDNPHNLIISILYEFGFIGFVFVFMYFRQIACKFVKAIHSPNTIGLAGFILLFLIISMGHFPIYLARLAPIIICSLALFEVSTA